MNWGQAIKIGFAAIAGFLSNIFGGFDAWFYTLVVFVIIDYITGVAKALMSKSEKTEKGGLDSRVMFRGGIKKILIFVVVAVAAQLDRVMGGGNTIRAIAIGYYVANEGLSALENIALCGVAVPAPLLSALEQLKGKNDDKNIKNNNEKSEDK